jgi:hypothetical protein
MSETISVAYEFLGTALWQSMYQIDPYLYIWYRWGMPPQAIDVHLQYFIDVDRSVLNTLDRLKIHNYPWPKQKINFWPARPSLHP